jgi:hypothetical protein
MMEFFLSKVWLFICGIAVTAVLVTAFSGLDHSVADGECQRRADQIAEIIDSAAVMSDVHITMQASDYLPYPDSYFMITDGYVSLARDGELRHSALHSDITLIGANGTAVRDCTLVHGDILVLSKDRSTNACLRVQVAKERTVSLTA